MDSGIVFGVAGLSVLAVFGFDAWLLRLRGLPIRVWPYALMGVAFVALFVVIFWPATNVWLANRGGAQ